MNRMHAHKANRFLQSRKSNDVQITRVWGAARGRFHAAAGRSGQAYIIFEDTPLGAMATTITMRVSFVVNAVPLSVYSVYNLYLLIKIRCKSRKGTSY